MTTAPSPERPAFPFRAEILQNLMKINVVPSEIQVELNGRLLPGFGPEDVIAELRKFF